MASIGFTAATVRHTCEVRQLFVLNWEIRVSGETQGILYDPLGLSVFERRLWTTNLKWFTLC